MSLIVAGRFTTFPAAEAAARQLFAEGFVEEDVSLFFVNPRGQHDHRAADALTTFPFSFNPVKHPGRGAMLGAVAGAVVGVGVFAPISASMVIAVTAAGVGAYVGALAGSAVQARVNATPSIEEAVRHAVHHETRDSGVLVAVHVCSENQLKAADVLRRAGSQAIERATGRWQHGRWADFDPTKPPVPITELTQREA
jgi:outer membrane lipoprotein SlyB